MNRWTPPLVALLFAFPLWLDFDLAGGGAWRVHHVVGLAIAIPAFVLWAIARYQLGSAFAARAEARSLVAHGLYARIRHPMYLFADIVLVGLLVFIGYPVLLLTMLVLVPWQMVRTRKEERVLEAAFGERYRTYRTSTWF